MLSYRTSRILYSEPEVTPIGIPTNYMTSLSMHQLIVKYMWKKGMVAAQCADHSYEMNWKVTAHFGYAHNTRRSESCHAI